MVVLLSVSVGGFRLVEQNFFPDSTREQFMLNVWMQVGTRLAETDAVLEGSFSGGHIGVYREGEDLLPVVVRAPEEERRDADFIQDAQIFSPAANQFIRVRQIVSGFTTELEDPILMRRNRLPTITVHAEQTEGLASTLRERIAPAVEVIPLPTGYRMEWGGEFEDSSQAQAALAGALPAFLLVMVFIVIVLFNSLRIALRIWLVVPLALLGIVVGLAFATVLTLFVVPVLHAAFFGVREVDAA
jgi:multidrug efflux pump subunit AcrB